MIELQDIFLESIQDYLDFYNASPQQYKAINAIMSCRTSKFGGHVDECDACGHIKISYNSCRNRHCPKCQGLAKERWIESMESNLLPVGYFHIVFTVPDLLNPLMLRNQKEMYTILFKAATESLSELALNKKYLGAQLGTTAILHTWGQNLMEHPHIHCIVPGGGLSKDGIRFILSRKKFFIPVKVLSRKFRGKFLYYLKESFKNKRLIFPGQIEELGKTNSFQKMIDSLYAREWIVYCKAPFKNSQHVIRYLGRYTHKVAISNTRIIGFKDGKVTFKWRDYKDNNKEKHMTLDSCEFIRRFLLHILPDKFVKIRHFGILSNRNKKIKISLCRKLAGFTSYTRVTKKLSAREFILKIKNIDINICPCCGTGTMLTKSKIMIQNCSPPIGNKTA